MKVALLQTAVTKDRKGNLQTALAAVRSAAEGGAELAVLPEMFCCPYRSRFFRPYAEPHGGELQKALAAAAKECGLYLIAGTIPELEGEKLYNTAFVYDPAGREIARHRKAHLFDINMPGQQVFRESDTLTAGDAVTVFDTPFGPMGLCVCFDIRFPEMSRIMALRGARVIFVPAAFTAVTGEAHWELLLRTRAVDNQCFTVGVGPARDARLGYETYGNSIAVDPWGTVLTRCGTESDIRLIDLDISRVDEIRQQLPLYPSRREELYHL